MIPDFQKHSFSRSMQQKSAFTWYSLSSNEVVSLPPCENLQQSFSLNTFIDTKRYIPLPRTSPVPYKSKSIENSDPLKQKIAEMVADFALIHDCLLLEYHDKEEKMKDMQSEEVEDLRYKMEELSFQYESEIQKKDNLIQQLHVLIESLRKKTSCDECAKLRLLLEEERKFKYIPKNTDDEEKLRAKITQLETLIRISREEKRDTVSMDKEIQFLQGRVTEKELLLSQEKSKVIQIENQLIEARNQMEELKGKNINFPLIEQRYSNIIETMKSEHRALVQEAKEKAKLYEITAQKLQEQRKLVLSLQTEVEKLKEEFRNSRDEANFQRTKKEEYLNAMTLKQSEYEKEKSVIVNRLETQLKEKTIENDNFKKMLSDCRRQLAFAHAQLNK